MLPRSTMWWTWPAGAVVLSIAIGFCSVFILPMTARTQDQAGVEPLTGVFAVTISDADIPDNLADGPALAGLWDLSFAADRTFTLVRQDVGQVASGQFETGATVLSFQEWQG